MKSRSDNVNPIRHNALGISLNALENMQENDDRSSHNIDIRIVDCALALPGTAIF